jgi:hypothetical protein
LELFVYTDKGEIATHHTYQTYNWLVIDELLLVLRDSSIYEYDDLEQLISKTHFIEYNYPNTGVFRNKTITKYDYYCDRQLKSETLEILPNNV